MGMIFFLLGIIKQDLFRDHILRPTSSKHLRSKPTNIITSCDNIGTYTPVFRIMVVLLE